MRWPRPPDWLIYAAVVAALFLLALLVHGPRPAQRPPAPHIPAGFPLEPATPFDPAVVAKPADARGAGAGTAFSVAARGVWLTARHVIDGCGRIVVVTAPGHGVLATARIDPAAETAVLYTEGGAPPLPIAPLGELARGAAAFHPGFPHGRPGETASRLMRRETLVLRRRREPVLAWLEVGRSPGLWGNLAGLSGAPALDAEGRVIGVTVAQAPRLHRLYTTTPAALRTALAAAGVSENHGVRRAIDGDSYGATADALRAALSVAQVVCLQRAAS